MSSTIFFTGHMIDRPGRSCPRFPTALESSIARRMDVELEGVSDGYSSAACGGDILFLEAILRRGGRAHVALPCSIEAFRKDCVDVIPGADWSERFDRILQAASSVEILGEEYASDNAMASECCSRVLAGLARRCAADKGERPEVLALWDGRPGDAFGGTQSAIEFCSKQGFTVRLMMDLARPGAAETRPLTPTRAGTSSAIRHDADVDEAPQQICAVVFADAVGFSKLSERQVPNFVRYYLECAMQSLRSQHIVPLVRNTWGDGLYLVFETMAEAGLFALQFRDNVMSAGWQQARLPYAPAVRVGVHAGPLFRIYDPVIGQWSYIGSHVTRAARLEPSTEPGKVLATLAFTALAATEEGASGFTCEAVGRRILVKNAGEVAVFELRRRA